MTALLYPSSTLVADSFSRSAESYDRAARLQRLVGDALYTQTTMRGTCLDLGCGTGYYAEKMQAQAQVSDCFGLDIAEGMLAYCRQRRSSHITWMQADARHLPLPDASLDSIFSSLMVQWLGPDAVLFNELHRVLKPGACVAFSTLLDGTLAELKSAWASVDCAQHVNDFDTAAAWQTAALEAGFTIDYWQPSTVVLSYTSVAELLRELKALGAHNVNKQRPRGMTGKQKFGRFVAAYEQYRQAEVLPATYQVLYAVLRRHD